MNYGLLFLAVFGGTVISQVIIHVIEKNRNSRWIITTFGRGMRVSPVFARDPKGTRPWHQLGNASLRQELDSLRRRQGTRWRVPRSTPDPRPSSTSHPCLTAWDTPTPRAPSGSPTPASGRRDPFGGPGSPPAHIYKTPLCHKSKTAGRGGASPTVFVIVCSSRLPEVHNYKTDASNSAKSLLSAKHIKPFL